MRIEKQAKRFSESLEYLYRLGHGGGMPEADLPKLDQSSVAAKSIIKSYQRFHNDLLEDGVLGPVTEIHSSRPRCCRPDIEPRRSKRSEWMETCGTIVTTHRLTARAGMTDDQLHNGWLSALAKWVNKTARLRTSFVRNWKDPSVKIRAEWGSMSRGTLAWSGLPSGNTCSQRMEQEYNKNRAWSFLYWWTTCLHELGHAFGLGHSSRGNIMNPYNEPEVVDFGAIDVRDIQLRYGIGVPGDPEPPVPGVKKRLLIEVLGDLSITHKIVGSNGGESPFPDFG